MRKTKPGFYFFVLTCFVDKTKNKVCACVARYSDITALVACVGRYRLLRQWAGPPCHGCKFWWAKPRPSGGGEAVVIKTFASKKGDDSAWGTFAREWGVLKYLQVWELMMLVLG